MERINFCVPSEYSVLMDWSENPETFAAFQQLMKTYHETATLRSVEPEIFHTEEMNEEVACIRYQSEFGTLFVVVNITDKEQTCTLPCCGETLALAPYEYKIMTK